MFKKIIELFTELRDYLELHNDNSIINMLKLLRKQVEDFHTYFVGEKCTLVHNSEYGGRYGKLKDDIANMLHKETKILNLKAYEKIHNATEVAKYYSINKKYCYN
jgi:hypothetical protein